MKVILLKDVAKVGQHGTVKEVTDGYALNFLIARGLAIQATPDKIAAYESAQKRETEVREREREALVKSIQSIEGARIEIAVRATEKGGLFKAVHERDVAGAILSEHALAVPEETIQFPEPIKTVGEHVIMLKSKSNKAEFGVVVTPAV